MSCWRRNMSRLSLISRAYARVQEIVSQYLNNGYNPTTREIQQAYYGNQYSSDSSTQYSTIYGCIQRGRKAAIEKWSQYLGSKEFWYDLNKIRYQAENECEDVNKKEEWKEYLDRLDRDGILSEDLLEVLPAFEVLFEHKMYEFSDEGTNFIITSGNPFQGESRWIRPSRAGWNIREEDLYKRSLKVLGTQFRRGLQTQVQLTSGESLRRTLEYTQPIKAALEDGNSWMCSHCHARNVGDASECAICGETREIDP